MRCLPILIGASALVVAVPAVVRSACQEPLPIMHMAMVPPAGGSFDLNGTGYAQADVGPVPRFWAFGNFAKANSGKANPRVEGAEFLLDPTKRWEDKGFRLGHWLGFGMNWIADDVVGCVVGLDPRRSVVELSFADPALEGSAEHAGFYSVVSVATLDVVFDLDAVKNAEGGRDIKVARIPAPGVTKVDADAQGRMVLTLSVTDPVSYSEEGVDKPVRLVAGTRLYYATGKEPMSSLPEGYKAVLDASDPSRELGLVPVGKHEVKVAVPGTSDPVWLVSRIQYQDATEILSNAVSSHAAAKPAAGVGGRDRRR